MSTNINRSDSCNIEAKNSTILGLLQGWEGIPEVFLLNIFFSAVSLENSNIFKTELIGLTLIGSTHCFLISSMDSP
jgi:hypothetical protein